MYAVQVVSLLYFSIIVYRFDTTIIFGVKWGSNIDFVLEHTMLKHWSAAVYKPFSYILDCGIQVCVFKRSIEKKNRWINFRNSHLVALELPVMVWCGQTHFLSLFRSLPIISTKVRKSMTDQVWRNQYAKAVVVHAETPNQWQHNSSTENILLLSRE